MDILYIVLIVLVLAGTWAIIELAITMHKTRADLDNIVKQVNDVAENTNEALEQVQPIITKVDGMLGDLEPAVQKVDPLLEKTNTALDVATVDLASLNDILVDVSAVTDTASNVTSTVSKATNSAVSGVAGVVGKFTAGKSKSANHHRISKHATSASEEAPHDDAADAPVEQPEEKPQHAYFTYGKHASSK